MAEVLLRRGHGDAASARAFLEAEGPRHDPLLLGDMGAACDRILAADRGRRADLRARRLRRRRHLRDGAGRPGAAVAGRRGRLAPAQPLRGGLRRRRPGTGAVGRRGREAGRHGRLRHHGNRGGGESPRARHGRDRDRPPSPCRAAARLPAGLHPAVGLSVPGAVRHRRGAEAGRGAVRAQRTRSRPARPAPRPGGAGHRRRRGAAAGREPRAGQGRPAPHGAHRQAGAAGADGGRPHRPHTRRGRRPRLPARPSHQRGRAVGAPRRRPRPAADR